MTTRSRIRLAVSTVLVAVAAPVGLVAAPAVAAAVPPWQSPAADPNNVGTLTFYDNTGAAITSGSTLTTLGSYVGTTGLTPLAGNTKAVLYAYTPNSSVAPGAWSGAALSGATSWPNAAAPAPLNTDTHPLVTESGGDVKLDDYATNSFPNSDSTTGYQHVYELRVFDTGTGGFDAKYASADVLVDSASHTWTQVFPAPLVNTAPGAPTGVGATGGDSSATVHWTAPVSDGGDPITKYTVTYTPSGGSAVTKDVTGATQTTLSPLVNGTTYTVSVTATNGVGTGPASSSVQVTPKFATAVTLNATPSSVKAGVAFTISGKLTSGAGTVSGKTIALTIGQAGHTAKHANVVTTSTGTFSYRATASYNASIYASYAGSATEAPSKSVTRKTTVNAVLKITSPTNLKKTTLRTLSVTGTTTPNKSGSTVTLYEKKSTGWVKLGTAKVSSTGKFTFKKTFAKGTHTIQVRIGATTTNGAGISPSVKFYEV